MRGEQGSMLPMFAGLLFVSFVMMTLAVELALLGAVWRQTADMADIAAEAGAAMIDVGRLHGGRVVLDPRTSGPAALAAVESFDLVVDEVAVDIGDLSICVTIQVRHPTQGLRFIGVRDIPIVVSRCAVPAVG